MNSRRCVIPVVLLIFINSAELFGGDVIKVAPAWSLSEGFQLPKSAFYDTKTKKVYVSNMGTARDARDGTGFISIITLDGKIDTAKWVTGLNAPKGLRIFEDTLWVSCLDELVGIDVPSAKVTKRVKPDGAKFLTDVAVARDGTVYVSDLLQNRIYSSEGRTAKVFAEGEEVEWPNGLVIDEDRLVVAAWGKPEPDFSTKVPGRLFAYDLATKKKSLITEKPVGNLDGVEPDGTGGYIVTDQFAGKVFRVDKEGMARPIIEGLKGPADIAYVREKALLIVPRLGDHTVAAYDLSRMR
jgi:DNA-binding beta-propeller fold protein YncE